MAEQHINVNEPEAPVSMGALMRTHGVLAVVVFATLGVLAVTDVLTGSPRPEWSAKLALVLLIVIAASAAIFALSRRSPNKR